MTEKNKLKKYIYQNLKKINQYKKKRRKKKTENILQDINLKSPKNYL